MPNPPSLEGLPPWAAIIATIVFGVATLWAMQRGYGHQPKSEQPQIAQLLGAQIADMGAIRRLADVCLELNTAVERLERATKDHEHFVREDIELTREVCMRLRELREALERRG